MSVTGFIQALSQRPQHPLQEVYSSLVDESSGIPSALDSPDQFLFRKPGRPKKQTSISAFKEALPKGRAGNIDASQSFKAKGSLRLDSSENGVDETADSSEFPVNNDRQAPTPEVELDSTFRKPNAHQMIRRSSSVQKQPQSKFMNAANSSFGDFDAPSSLPDVGLMRNFSPIASSTQFIQKESFVGVSDKNESIFDLQTSDLLVASQLVHLSTSLQNWRHHHKVANKPFYRPGPVSSKKRMSVSGFTAVLGRFTALGLFHRKRECPSLGLLLCLAKKQPHLRIQL